MPPPTPSSAPTGTNASGPGGRFARVGSRASGRRCARPGASCGRARSARGASTRAPAGSRGSPRRARRARVRKRAGKPLEISQTCRSCTLVTPGWAAIASPTDCGESPSGAASSRICPLRRRSGQAVRSIDAGHGERRDGIGALEARRPDDEPCRRGRGEGVEVREQVAVAALDVQVAPVRACDLPEGDDVHGRADERGDEHEPAADVGRRIERA